MIRASTNDYTLNIGVGTDPWVERGTIADFLCSGDTERRNLAHAKDICPKAEFIRLDAHFLPFKRQVFDKVAILEVLEHLDDDKKCVEEINRVLKESGQITLSVPIDNIINHLSFFNYLKHKRHYLIAQISKLLIQNGFRMEEIKVSGGIWDLISEFIYLVLKHLFRSSYREPNFLRKRVEMEYENLPVRNQTRGRIILLNARKVASLGTCLGI